MNARGGLYLSETALRDLKLLNKEFPLPPAQRKSLQSTWMMHGWCTGLLLPTNESTLPILKPTDTVPLSFIPTHRTATVGSATHTHLPKFARQNRWSDCKRVCTESDKISESNAMDLKFCLGHIYKNDSWKFHKNSTLIPFWYFSYFCITRSVILLLTTTTFYYFCQNMRNFSRMPSLNKWKKMPVYAANQCNEHVTVTCFQKCFTLIYQIFISISWFFDA